MASHRATAFAIKAEVRDLDATSLAFEGQKTMYGGKHIAAGDLIYIFASEIQGGRGLVARGRVTAARAVPRRPEPARQTPRVSLEVSVLARATQPLGRAELKANRDFASADPRSELNFKLYRQATNKVIGVSAAAAALLESCF